jgi:hypothetical protein
MQTWLKQRRWDDYETKEWKEEWGKQKKKMEINIVTLLKKSYPNTAI